MYGGNDFIFYLYMGFSFLSEKIQKREKKMGKYLMILVLSAVVALIVFFIFAPSEMSIEGLDSVKAIEVILEGGLTAIAAAGIAFFLTGAVLTVLLS